LYGRPDFPLLLIALVDADYQQAVGQ
jgi:hypothetical protein